MKIPRFALHFLKGFCPDYLFEEIEGDLIQRFEHDVKTFGERKAKRKLMWNVIRFFRPGIVLRNRFSVKIIHAPMLKNYFVVTLRHIRKSKINAISKVGGLTLALFSSLIIYLYVFYQQSFDRYHDGYENIYRVNTERRENDKMEKYGIAPLTLGPMLYQRFPEIEAYARLDISNGSHVRYNQKVVSCGVFPVDSSLFDVFTFQFIHGGKNALAKPGSIVLDRSTAYDIFGDEDPMNKLLTINNQPKLYEVTAIIEDMRPNTHFRIDAFIPIEREAGFTINNITSPVEFVDQSSVLYIKFRDDADPSSFPSKLESLLDEHVSKKDREKAGFNIFLQPLADIYFDNEYKYEFTKKGSTLYLYIFIVLGVFLLLVAGINYINLTVADFSGRLREIGVRKVMGALKRQIALQILLETILFCCSALVLSIFLLYCLFPSVLGFLEPNLKFAMLIDKPLIVAVSLTLLILTVFATAFPAYWLATSNTATDLKGSSTPGRYARLSKILLASQFIISIICISATLTINRQLNYIHNKDLGFDRKNLLVLTMPENFSVKKMQSLKAELESTPGVQSVSNSSFRIGGGFWKDWYTVEVDGQMKSLELYEVFSDDDLFRTLGMRLLHGRLFNADYPADSGAAFVINETAAQTLGWKDPIGKRIFTHPEENGRWDGTVVGVVADINISTLHQKIQPLVMRLPWQNNYPEYFVYIRVNGSLSATIQAVKNKYSEIEPGYPIDIEFVDDSYNANYGKENKAYASLQFGTMIIIFVSSIGIFSLSIYMSARRMKEFGIRKILGAAAYQITFLHIGQFLKIALLANVIALPIAYWLISEWLSKFAYRTELSSFLFLFVMAISILLVIISAGYSSWKAGRMNPVDVIKS